MGDELFPMSQYIVFLVHSISKTFTCWAFYQKALTNRCRSLRNSRGTGASKTGTVVSIPFICMLRVLSGAVLRSRITCRGEVGWGTGWGRLRDIARRPWCHVVIMAGWQHTCELNNWFVIENETPFSVMIFPQGPGTLPRFRPPFTDENVDLCSYAVSKHGLQVAIQSRQLML